MTFDSGVYDTSSGQTLYLFVDLKTDGPTTWPFVLKALQPLRDWAERLAGASTDEVLGPAGLSGRHAQCHLAHADRQWRRSAECRRLGWSGWVLGDGVNEMHVMCGKALAVNNAI